MLTQIYEVSTPEEAWSISEIGVDHIGVLVGNGEFPRELPRRSGGEGRGRHRPDVEIFGAVPDRRHLADRRMGAEILAEIVHLGAAPELLTWTDAATLKTNLPGILLMSSVPVIGEGSIEIARSYNGLADFSALG